MNKFVFYRLLLFSCALLCAPAASAGETCQKGACFAPVSESGAFAGRGFSAPAFGEPAAETGKKGKRPGPAPRKIKAGPETKTASTENYSENFRATSSLIHLLAGAAFLLLALAKTYSYKNPGGKNPEYFSAGALVLAGFLSLFFIARNLGGGSFESVAETMRIQPGFFVFVSMSLVIASLGFCEILFLLKKGVFWKYSGLALLSFLVFILLTMHEKVNLSARDFVLWRHAAAGACLALFVLSDFFHALKPLKSLKAISLAALAAASLFLATYCERADSFGYRIVTITSAAENK